mmetsp:Transcript_80326/g.232057  ORF Transcript_80326/g.232057 Transcript_80326/m.232057 type:complete len:607 (+) Transcript_80326:93-1913(+)
MRTRSDDVPDLLLEDAEQSPSLASVIRESLREEFRSLSRELLDCLRAEYKVHDHHPVGLEALRRSSTPFGSFRGPLDCSTLRTTACPSPPLPGALEEPTPLVMATTSGAMLQRDTVQAQPGRFSAGPTFSGGAAGACPRWPAMFGALNAGSMRHLAKNISSRRQKLTPKAGGRLLLRDGTRSLDVFDTSSSRRTVYSQFEGAHYKVMQLVQRVVTSNWFDSIVCVVLLLNSVLIGIQASENAAGVTTMPPHWRALDIFFCVFYVVELGMRLLVWRWAFFRVGQWSNYFDLFLVILLLVDELFLAASGDSKQGLQNAGILRLARVLRLLRVLRVLRVIRFVSELRKVVYLIIGSVGSFVWTGVLIVLLIYIIGVFFTQIVADYAISEDLTEAQEANAQVLRHSFGSTLKSFYTLYQAITGGFDWVEVHEPLMDNVHPLVGLVFVLYTAFALLVLLNLVTGVFVDGALKVSRADKETELLEKAYSLFQRGDADDSGEITWEEFRACLGSDEASGFFEALEISQARAEDLFLLIDQSRDGKLSLEEFVAGGLMLQGPAKALDVAVVAQNLQVNLTTIMRHLGIPRSKVTSMGQSGFCFEASRPTTSEAG